MDHIKSCKSSRKFFNVQCFNYERASHVTALSLPHAEHRPRACFNAFREPSPHIVISAMDALDWAAQNQGAVLLTAAAVIFAGTLLVLTKSNGEEAVLFEVPFPPQCEPGWKGEILENPSIKVRMFFSFQSRNTIFARLGNHTAEVLDIKNIRRSIFRESRQKNILPRASSK